MTKQMDIEARRGGLAVGRRVMAVLRLACRVVVSGRRRAIGRLGGAAAASLVLGALGGLSPVWTDEAVAACVLASGTYTCSGTDQLASFSVSAMTGVTLAASYDSTSLNAYTGAEFHIDDGDLVLTTEAGSVARGTGRGLYLAGNGAGSVNATLAGTINASGFAQNGLVVETALSGGVAITQSGGTISGGRYGVSLANLATDSAMTFTQEAGSISGFIGINIINTADEENPDAGSHPYIVNIGGTVENLTSDGWAIAADATSVITVESGGLVTGFNGITANTRSTINVHGTINVSGDVAISLGSRGNTLNIYSDAVIVGAVDFQRRPDNVINFNTGAYTLSVKEYNKASNTVNALGSAHNVIYALDGNGDGNIILMNASAPVAQASSITTDYSRSVLGLTGDIIDLDIARPLYNPGEPLGYASAKRKANPTEIQTGSLGQGNTFDAYGNLFWMRGLGGVTEKDTTASQTGSNSSQFGLVAGVDHQYGDWRLGLFGGGGEAHMSMKDGSGELKGDLGLLGAYARIASGKAWLDATVQGGYLRSTSERSVNSGAETAKGDFNGWFTGLELAASTRIDLAPNWSLTPTLKGRYSAAFYDAYSETGSSQNVSYDSHVAQALEERFETKLTYVASSANGLTSKYWLKGAVSATERLGQSEFGATVSGIDFNVETLGDRAVYAATVGLGFDAMVTKNASIFASVDGTLASDHSRSGVARGGVKVAF